MGFVQIRRTSVRSGAWSDRKKAAEGEGVKRVPALSPSATGKPDPVLFSGT